MELQGLLTPEGRRHDFRPAQKVGPTDQESHITSYPTAKIKKPDMIGARQFPEVIKTSWDGMDGHRYHDILQGLIFKSGTELRIFKTSQDQGDNAVRIA